MRLIAALPLLALATATSAQDGPAGPELFAPVSTDAADEMHVAFTPDGRRVYFVRRAPDGRFTIHFAERRDEGWSDPVVAPFSGRFNDQEPFISPDGRRFYFTSDRPLTGAEPDRGRNAWVMVAGDSGWGPPRRLEAPVRVDRPAADSGLGRFWGQARGPTEGPDGALLFWAERPGSLGHTDLYRAPRRGTRFDVPENLGAPISSARYETGAALSPDGRWLVFGRDEAPDGYGLGDLYVAERTPDGWSAPRNLGPAVNSDQFDFAPRFSPDGERLFFSSNRGPAPGERGRQNIYSVPARILAPDPTFELHTLHPRVHAALVTDRPPYYAFANSLVVVGDSGVLIVDTQQSPAAARDLVRALPSLTDRPVRWVVNTHWHPDHVFGNVAWKEAFPDAVTVGHRSLRHDVPDRAAAMRDDDLASLPASIDQRRRWLADGHRDGVPLDSATRAALAYSLEVRQRQVEQLRGLRLVPPDVVVDDSLTLDLGGIAVRLLHLGPAHTPGDLAVHVPDAGVLAVGDLLEWGTPWLDGACAPGWARALDRLRRVPADTILMGHGPLVGPDVLELYADVLDAVATGRDLAPFRERFAALGVSGPAFDRFAAAAPATVAAADSAGACRPRAAPPAGGAPTAAPADDPIEQLLRLHHDQRVHHLLGRAEPFVATFHDPLTSVDDGEVALHDAAASVARFRRYFGAVRFLEWEDVDPPRVAVSGDGASAHVVVSKRVRTIASEGPAAAHQATRFAWSEHWVRGPPGWRLHAIASTDRPADHDPEPASLRQRLRALEILDRARAALGGHEAVAAVATLAFDAGCRGPRGPYRTAVGSARDGRFRFVQTFPTRPAFALGRSLGGPWADSGDDPPADSLSAFQRFVAHAHELHLLALAPESRFASPRADDDDALDGSAAHVVRAFHPDTRTPVDFLYDPGSGRPLGFRIPAPPGPDPRPILARFDDWRPVDAIRLPFSLTIHQGDDAFTCAVTSASTAWLPDSTFAP